MRSPEEFERIRAANRVSLGMAGMAGTPLGVSGFGDGILGSALGVAGPIRARSAFPATSVEFDPATMAQPDQRGSGLGWWLTTRVIRPEVEYAGVRFAPGDGYYDASWIARIIAWVTAFGVAAGTAWLFYRAFGAQRRSNVKRSRYFVTRRTS